MQQLHCTAASSQQMALLQCVYMRSAATGWGCDSMLAWVSSLRNLVPNVLIRPQASNPLYAAGACGSTCTARAWSVVRASTMRRIASLRDLR